MTLELKLLLTSATAAGDELGPLGSQVRPRAKCGTQLVEPLCRVAEVAFQFVAVLTPDPGGLKGEWGRSSEGVGRVGYGDVLGWQCDVGLSGRGLAGIAVDHGAGLLASVWSGSSV